MTAKKPSLTLTLGTVSGVALVADLHAQLNAGESPWDIKKVQLSANYVMANPPGYPNRPPAGQVASKFGQLGTVLSGTQLQLHAHEAAALVAAGAATYV